MIEILKKKECEIQIQQHFSDNEKSSFGLGLPFFYDKEISILNRIKKQIDNYPSRIALKFRDTQLTYAELDEKINQLGNYIKNKIQQPELRIAVYQKPGIDLVISILAILKVGGAYIPLDISYPTERLNFILQNSEAQLILTESRLIAKLDHVDCQVIKLDMELFSIVQQSKSMSDLSTGQSLAYIIYTSGSTGTPKGVKIHHRSMVNHMLWMIDYFNFTKNDRFLLKTPISFDPSVWEIFAPLCIGAELVIAPENTHLDPMELAELIKKNEISIVQFVPSILQEFLKQDDISSCQTLRHIFSGGETLRTGTKKLFFEKLSCQLHNLYGPTEATIDVVSHTVPNTEYEIQHNIIGIPIYNTELLVLDDQGISVGIGEIGELHIVGDCLASGYYNRPDLTREKFVSHPIDQAKKMYKTGDLVRWLETGLLEYCGRNNDQLKVNGVRIEPDEIIHQILTDETVSDCRLIKIVVGDDSESLACYLSPKQGFHIDIEKIKNHLKFFFPSYMLPSTYTLLDRIPLTPNGKVDMTQLPKIPSSKKSTENEEQMTLEEKGLLVIWKDLFKINEIGLEDHFFDLGGHSILAIQLLQKIKAQFNIHIPISEILSSPTIKSLANAVKKINLREHAPKISPIICLQREGKKTPLFLIHPVGGTVFWYAKLAKHLGGDRPIYGIQDLELDRKKEGFDTIESLAKEYCSEIQDVQKEGPYVIGGASFGGTVAIEIANQLRQKNEKISCIILLDAWGLYPNSLLNPNYFVESMHRQHSDLKELFDKHQIEENSDLLSLQWRRLNMLWRYHPKKITHPLVVFKANEILPVFQEVDEPSNHWQEYTDQKIQPIFVPGNHETMFYEPNVSVLADKVNAFLGNI